MLPPSLPPLSHSTCCEIHRGVKMALVAKGIYVAAEGGWLFVHAEDRRSQAHSRFLRFSLVIL